jgi:hypothetical protein
LHIRGLVFLLIISVAHIDSLSHPAPAGAGSSYPANLPAPGAGPVKPADFNGDGFADLAIGIFGQAIGSAQGAGAVSVLYGSAGGVSATDQLWTQDSTGIVDGAEANDFFGSSVAAGDFNGDGLSDLAIGVPQERNGTDLTGALHVLYGTMSGLSATNADFYFGGTSNVNYGFSLATGDFDGDGFDDLAVGDPKYDTATASNAGGVGIHTGSATGLGLRRTTWHQNSVGILDSAESGDQFGRSLATGDFNNDGFADMAVGVPSEDFGVTDLGMVSVIYGSTTGLTSAHNQAWCADPIWGIDISAEPYERFGFAVAAADYNADGFDDLAAGAPGKTINTLVNAGMVIVLPGSNSRLTATGHQIWIQNDAGPDDYSETGDYFGAVLVSGNFNGDLFDDLAIGVPEESVGGATLGGAINLFLGSAGLLTASGAQFWNQNSSDIADSAEMGDRFGMGLASGDFNGDGVDDLAVGVPLEYIGSVQNAGMIHVLYGTGAALSATGSQIWHQNSAGVIGTAETKDYFGASLASGTNSRGWFLY